MTRSYIIERLAGANARDDRLGNLLGALALGIGDAMQDAFEREGLDLRAATVLVALLDFSPSGSVRRLSQVIGLTHSGAVRVVDRLAEAGLVERQPGHDLRSLGLRLTGTGRRVASRLRGRRRHALRSLLTTLTAKQHAALTEGCETLIAQLTSQRLAMRASGEAPAGGALCRLCDFAACGRPEGRCPAASRASDGVLRPA